MADMNCPNCNTTMEKVADPDVTTDECPNCGGMFLNKGELNVLATALAGDIEYCSIDHDRHKDRFPTRACPRCQDQQMGKVNLLAFSSIIFDVCPRCEGFFLDKGEVEAANIDLLALSSAESGDEFRGHRDGHLVRINRVRDVWTYSSVLRFGAPAGTPVEYIGIAVYFLKPLGLGLRISHEKWTSKLAKVFGLFKAQDISTGDEEFDETFVIHGADADQVRNILSENARKTILRFLRKKPSILSKPGSLEVLDDRVVYREGPYPGQVRADLHKEAGGIIDDLLNVARTLESA